MSKTIEINCEGAKKLHLDEIFPLQGNLKTLDKENEQKLVDELLRHGYSEPISVWDDGSEYKVLNGHQRLKVLKKLKKDGYKIDEIPVSVVKAKDLREAKEKILAMASQYGKLTQSSLEEFLKTADIDFTDVVGTISFPEIDFDIFENVLQHKEEIHTDEREADVDESKMAFEVYKNNTIKQIVLYFDGETYLKTISRLNAAVEQMGVENFTDVMLRLLDEHDLRQKK
jgi:hypothetical protein